MYDNQTKSQEGKCGNKYKDFPLSKRKKEVVVSSSSHPAATNWKKQKQKNTRKNKRKLVKSNREKGNPCPKAK